MPTQQPTQSSSGQAETNVLITGVDGFVGSHLTRLLTAKPGTKLFGLVRRNFPVAPTDPAVQLVEAEISVLAQPK